MGMDRQSAQEPCRERNSNVWKPAALPDQKGWSSFSHCLAFYISSPAKTSLGWGNGHLPTPVGGTWWELNVQKKQSITVLRHKLFSNICSVSVIPTLSINHLRDVDSVAYDPDPRVPDAGHWVPWFSSRHKCSPHILTVSSRDPKRRNLL